MNETPEDVCFNQIEVHLNTIAVQPTIKNNCKELFCNSGSIIRIGCILHKLQLVTKHSIKKVPKIQEVTSVSLEGAKILRNNKKWILWGFQKIPTFYLIRWNSLFEILEYLIKSRIHVTKFIKEHSTELNAEFIILMEKDNIIFKIHVLLKKFFVVTKLLESKKFCVGELFVCSVVLNRIYKII